MSREFDQLRAGVPVQRGFDFAAVLAQLGRNPGEAERFVDLLFGLARDALRRRPRGTGRIR